MRPVQLADLEVVARVLLLLDPAARPALMARLIQQAARADQHRIATGQPHPHYGTGTLMSAAGAYRKAKRMQGLGRDELDAMRCAINGLIGDTADHIS